MGGHSTWGPGCHAGYNASLGSHASQPIRNRYQGAIDTCLSHVGTIAAAETLHEAIETQKKLPQLKKKLRKA